MLELFDNFNNQFTFYYFLQELDLHNMTEYFDNNNLMINYKCFF
jgi:hypothetical protein